MASESAPDDIRQAFARARDLDASMNTRLGTFADAARRLNPTAAGIIDRLVDRLKENGAGQAAPKVGEPMPSFVLPDETGRMVSLKEMLPNGPVIVTFHRGHWCPYCRISINTLVKAQPRINKLGAQMIAIVPERGQFAAKMKNESNVEFPFLLDIDNGYALSLNLAIWVGAEMEKFMTSVGSVLPEFQGNDSWMLPIPATFVIGQDGRIKARFVDPDYRRRMTVEELLQSLETPN
jgi:peroxiredoxin